MCVFQAADKRKALEETMAFTTQALASVAYQVGNLASHTLRMLDLQGAALRQVEARVSALGQVSVWAGVPDQPPLSLWQKFLLSQAGATGLESQHSGRLGQEDRHHVQPGPHRKTLCHNRPMLGCLLGKVTSSPAGTVPASRVPASQHMPACFLPGP